LLPPRPSVVWLRCNIDPLASAALETARASSRINIIISGKQAAGRTGSRSHAPVTTPHHTHSIAGTAGFRSRGRSSRMVIGKREPGQRGQRHFVTTSAASRRPGQRPAYIQPTGPQYGTAAWSAQRRRADHVRAASRRCAETLCTRADSHKDDRRCDRPLVVGRKQIE
jgi:hypothetical protein